MLPKIQPNVIAMKQDKYRVNNTNRVEMEKIRAMLLNERSTFFSHWEELGRYILPRRTRFYTTDVDRGNRRNYSIVNGRGTIAARNCRGGMMSAFTSPSREWFRLTTQDPDLARYEPVQEWLYTATRIEHEVFLRSNTYNSLPMIYGDLEVFGTAAMMLMEDFTGRIIHTYPFVVGSFYLIPDAQLRVGGFMRDFRLTVRQVVEQFGTEPGTNDINWANLSSLVKTLWDNGNTESWIEISHGILPNKDWNPGSASPDKKRYLSIYYERGSQQTQYTLSDTDSWKVLSKKGYDRFRIMAPRWEISGEDIYGTSCPGMDAIGDIQQLQMQERRGSQALEKFVNPPMIGPSQLRTAKASVLPGDITYLDNPQGMKFEPAYQINPNFEQLEFKNKALEERIKEFFFDDLWHVISNLEKGNVTAEEIRALKEEKLQDIGPVVDRLTQELLEPLVEQTFEIMMTQRILPPPPPELQKQQLRIQYTSIMSMAQKALGASSLERFWGFCTQIQAIAPQDPSKLDRVDVDELLEKYGEDISIAPGIIRDDDQVKKLRDQRQQQMAQQQKLAAMEQASKTAKNLGDSDTSGGNALSDLLDQAQAGSMMPAGTPQ